MEITGKIIVALPEVTGTSKAGNPWKKKEYVLETQESFPRKIFFDFFGDKADQYPLQVGQEVKLYFDIESREYQGRWYTSIRGWKAEAPGATTQQPSVAQPSVAGMPPYPGVPAQTYGTVPPPPPMPASDPTEDIPF